MQPFLAPRSAGRPGPDNSRRFADYKERVINLLMRVTTVSLKTVEIVQAMRTAPH